MKNIYITLALICCMSCSEDFLKLYPETTLNEANFFKSDEEYILLVNGCYVPMRDYSKLVYLKLAELPSDNASSEYNARAGGGGDMTDFIQMRLSSNNIHIADFWNKGYQGVSRCNESLHALDEATITWKNEEYKARCYGETYFLRALYYFDLVRQFGGVPLVIAPITSQEAVNIKRSSEEIIYQQIESDLKEASSYFSNAVDVDEDGRADYGAAMALLGKVYLTLHRYADAEKVLKSVIDLNQYILLPDYKDLFEPSKKDFKETIFAIQYSEGNSELANDFIFRFVPLNSKGEITNRPNVSIGGNPYYGLNQPTLDLIESFEVGDKRSSVSIGYWTGPDWENVVRSLPYCAKFKPPISASDWKCGDNFPVLRYSDVLLMYAEVLNQQGRTAEAIPFVEQIRSRAGLTNNLIGYSKEALEELIADERQREFCFENQRWYDLKRTGKAVEVMNAHGVRERKLRYYMPGLSDAYYLTNEKLLVPIPVEQILINGLEQNPGY